MATGGKKTTPIGNVDDINDVIKGIRRAKDETSSFWVAVDSFASKIMGIGVSEFFEDVKKSAELQREELKQAHKAANA